MKGLFAIQYSLFLVLFVQFFPHSTIFHLNPICYNTVSPFIYAGIKCKFHSLKIENSFFIRDINPFHSIEHRQNLFVFIIFIVIALTTIKRMALHIFTGIKEYGVKWFIVMEPVVWINCRLKNG